MSHEPGHNADTAASDHIECDRHGHAHAAFICQHLLAQPRQHWACEYPTPDQPWPDAWCAECDAAFLQAGGWDESNEATADIQMVCSSCYNELKAESVLTLDEAELEAWNAGQHASGQWLAARQAALIAEYAFTSYPRYDYDQHAATLTFSGAERPDLIADVEFVGTLSTASGTWMWSWANFSLAEPVRSRITQVRDAHTGIPHLTVPLWAADQHDGWHMTAIAAEVLDAKGAYRVPTDHGFIYMVMLDMHYRQ